MPEAEDSSLAQLEELFEQDRQEAVKTVTELIRAVGEGRVFAPEDLAHFVGAAQVLDQVFLRPVLPLELKQQAIKAIRLSKHYKELKAKLREPGFDLQTFWFLAAVLQYFPEDRAALGITDQVIDEWLSRFPRLDDNLSFEQKPFVLSYLAQIRPDRKAQCREMLQKIGFSRGDLGEDLWAAKGVVLKSYKESTAEGLVGTRLLQPERSLNDGEKQTALRAFGGRNRALAGFGRSLSQYANIAILLAPRVEIDSSGKINLLTPKSLSRSPKLPERPGV